MSAVPNCSELSSRPPLEMWGGVECTVNRVGDRYFDQIARSGHSSRVDDLDRFAELGLTSLRFPLLWEHVQPERDAPPDWRWPDLALDRLRELGVRPIVGLLHHGLGPQWVDAREPAFVEHFARYARMVAERYPWIDAYTPVNEPLTTARFSGLYGHWYPHARDDSTFVRLFLAQLSATSRAMAAIRTVNPRAQLIQTEDLGKVASTPALESQRDFENERRWLTWDILSGALTPAHACWSYLVSAGSSERELSGFAESPCAPSMIGINHYITSERFLDERVERYALDEIGGNGREVYADVAQVQLPALGREGIGALLREAWERYRTPIAITECHMGCTREEQMRWLHELWCASTDARAEGVDVRAVTSWALLGSYDWNSLVTRETEHYESGAFDAREGVPRATALAQMIRGLATEGEYAHPVLEARGWWHRDGGSASGRPIAIASTQSELGRALAAECERRGLAHVASDGVELSGAWALICSSLGPAERESLTESCLARGVRFVHWSSDSSGDARDDEGSTYTLDVRSDDHVGARELAGALLDLLLDDELGAWHLDTDSQHDANAGAHRVGELWASPAVPLLASAPR